MIQAGADKTSVHSHQKGKTIKTRITALVGIGLLALTACASGEQEPGPTVTVTEAAPSETVTETAPPSPETSATAEQEVEDEWLAEARDEHLVDLTSWFMEYRDADCLAGEPECYDLFLEGLPMMEAYNDFIMATNDEQPNYVPAFYGSDVAMATRSMDRWQHACPDAADCYDIGLEVGSDVFGIITETNDWGG